MCVPGQSSVENNTKESGCFLHLYVTSVDSKLDIFRSKMWISCKDDDHYFSCRQLKSPTVVDS